MLYTLIVKYTIMLALRTKGYSNIMKHYTYVTKYGAPNTPQVQPKFIYNKHVVMNIYAHSHCSKFNMPYIF